MATQKDWEVRYVTTMVWQQGALFSPPEALYIKMESEVGSFLVVGSNPISHMGFLMIAIIIMKYLLSVNLKFYQSLSRCTQKKRKKARTVQQQ